MWGARATGLMVVVKNLCCGDCLPVGEAHPTTLQCRQCLHCGGCDAMLAAVAASNSTATTYYILLLLLLPITMLGEVSVSSVCMRVLCARLLGCAVVARAQHNLFARRVCWVLVV